MKNNYLILFLFVFLLKATSGLCVTHTIISNIDVNSNFIFQPDSISANVGDTILFNLNPAHFPKEVDSATWAINDSVSLHGQFNFVLGSTGQFAVNGINTAKIYYYVCGVHFAMAMKGRIFVSNPTGINSITNTAPGLEIFPNPVSKAATIYSNLPAGKENQLRIFDLSGKCVYEKKNISPVQYLDLLKRN